nr:MAG TPA: hypothetical protein [Caudoviricetes sp.]
MLKFVPPHGRAFFNTKFTRSARDKTRRTAKPGLAG